VVRNRTGAEKEKRQKARAWFAKKEKRQKKKDKKSRHKTHRIVKRKTGNRISPYVSSTWNPITLQSNRMRSRLFIESNFNQMPVMDGHDATKVIRAVNASIPIVGVTGPNPNPKIEL
jgi:hypothetical protein